MKLDPEENVPEYDQIFLDDEVEDDDTEAGLLRRREKRLWEEERGRVQFRYYRNIEPAPNIFSHCQPCHFQLHGHPVRACLAVVAG